MKNVLNQYKSTYLFYEWCSTQGEAVAMCMFNQSATFHSCPFGKYNQSSRDFLGGKTISLERNLDPDPWGGNTGRGIESRETSCSKKAASVYLLCWCFATGSENDCEGFSKQQVEKLLLQPQEMIVCWDDRKKPQSSSYISKAGFPPGQVSIGFGNLKSCGFVREHTPLTHLRPSVVKGITLTEHC